MPIRSRRSRSRSRPALITVAAIALAIAVVAWLSRRFLRVEVAGESMTPALHPGDFVLLRPGPPADDAAYGAIVAVYDPRPEQAEQSRLLLKRIVGLPGESLRIGAGPVQINGRPLIEPYAHGAGPGEQHRGINRLAAGEYFLVGDHRGASTDSRDFGPVPRERIVGTAVYCYWPPEHAGRITPPTRSLAGAEPDLAPPGERGGTSPIPVARPDEPGPSGRRTGDPGPGETETASG